VRPTNPCVKGNMASGIPRRVELWDARACDQTKREAKEALEERRCSSLRVKPGGCGYVGLSSHVGESGM